MFYQGSILKRSVTILGPIVALLLSGLVSSAFGEEGAAKLTADSVQLNLNYVWTLIAAFLVFFMQAGFALVEAGFTRAKNACNIIMKNLMDFSVGAVAFFAIGFALMFGTSSTSLGVGSTGFFLSDFAREGDPWVYAFFMFQVVFCATAATIVSAAMA